MVVAEVARQGMAVGGSIMVCCDSPVIAVSAIYARVFL